MLFFCRSTLYANNVGSPKGLRVDSMPAFRAAMALRDAAYLLGSTDNISVVVVQFSPAI